MTAAPEVPVQARWGHAPTLRRRMACWMYEGVLLFGVVFLTDYLFSTLSQTRNALDHRWGQQAFLFLVLGIYFVWFWHKGQTLAMKTWHIKITDVQGRPVTQARALWRYALCWIWFLPPLMAIQWTGWPLANGLWVLPLWVCIWAASSRAHSHGQFWHDAWAGTRLIDSRP
jgi:uncharacterized RDD family membrane protein YckC